jgi:putative membrane protein
MVTKITLTDLERVKVRDAIAEAEKNTSGEIFVVVARVSDDYRSVPILWATAIALSVPLPLLLLTRMPALDTYLVQLAIFVLSALVLSLSPIRIHTVPLQMQRVRAHERAVEQFLAHGLHMTETRTGALIFVSLAERYAEIVADAGIVSKVPQSVWDIAIANLVLRIREGELADGLRTAVGDVGKTLAAHFPPRLIERDEVVNEVVLL